MQAVNEQTVTMDRLKPGQSAVIQAVGGSGSLRHHLLDMGLTPQTEVTLQKTAPMGDPVQIKLRGYELTLRLDEARKIEIGAVYQKTGVETRPLSTFSPGPGGHQSADQTV